MLVHEFVKNNLFFMISEFSLCYKLFVTGVCGNQKMRNIVPGVDLAYLPIGIRGTGYFPMTPKKYFAPDRIQKDPKKLSEK